ncbi:MAG: hypothetical protein EOO77_45030 [Oxalobacteraceae bacterium]|nr:MAG: hypothetical protein EOO77_45030 [Oxalobacteraceae bacterium]
MAAQGRPERNALHGPGVPVEVVTHLVTLLGLTVGALRPSWQIGTAIGGDGQDTGAWVQVGQVGGQPLGLCPEELLGLRGVEVVLSPRAEVG